MGAPRSSTTAAVASFARRRQSCRGRPARRASGQHVPCRRTRARSKRSSSLLGSSIQPIRRAPSHRRRSSRPTPRKGRSIQQERSNNVAGAMPARPRDPSSAACARRASRPSPPGRQAYAPSRPPRHRRVRRSRREGGSAPAGRRPAGRWRAFRPSMARSRAPRRAMRRARRPAGPPRRSPAAGHGPPSPRSACAAAARRAEDFVAGVRRAMESPPPETATTRGPERFSEARNAAAA